VKLTSRFALTAGVACGLTCSIVFAAQPAPAAKDGASPPAAPAAADPVARIREEGLKRSEVMATVLALTDLNGARLTGSPGLQRASEWARRQLGTWGLANPRFETWDPFGRGWVLKRFSLQAFTPEAMPVIAHPRAWSPSVPDGKVEGEVVYVDIKGAADLERYRGQLRGKIILNGEIVVQKVAFEPLALRKTDAQLLALANSDGVGTGVPRPTTPSPIADPAQRASIAFTPRRYQFFSEEGVAAILEPSGRGETGTFFTLGARVYPPAGDTPAAKPETPAEAGSAAGSPTVPRGISPWKTDCPPIVPQISVANEHYNRLVRLAQHGTAPRMALELSAEYLSADVKPVNVLAEIPGRDRADEIVMLGAHLDSWHSGTGATDNATGCAVVMEAMRILQALKLEPRRTIRLALWSGEEQGLLGSKAYVTAHFGTPPAPPTGGSTQSGPAPLAVKDRQPGYEKLSAYYNLDNGGGKIRGIYLQGNEAARPIFRDWLKSFRDLEADTISLSRTGSTDHVSFDAIGLPGFQFIQDDLEYRTRTWHGNMDVYDRVVADDLKQAAVVMAAVVYQTAMRDEKIPRKPLTPPTPPAKSTGSGKKKQSKSD
jgi:hypothetical protein